MKQRIHRPLGFAGLIVLFLLAGCRDEPTSPGLTDDAPHATPLGVVEVTITGLGEAGEPRASAISAATVAELDRLRAARLAGAGGGAGGELAPQALTAPANGDASGNGTIQLDPVATGSFTSGERGAGGFRYLYATFRVRNARTDGTPYDTPRENLTFIAVSTDSAIGDSPLSRLDRFDGTPAATTLATQILPTGAVTQDRSGAMVVRYPDVLQAFLETEVDAAALPRPAGVTNVFPYGFVVTNPASSTSRTLPASPAASAYDGLVTFAFRVPLQADPAADPFTMSVVFLAMDDDVMRVTQSPEEQTVQGRVAFDARADQLGATQLRVLYPGGGHVGGVPARHICSLRATGPAGAPTSWLGADPTTASFSSLTPDPYAADGSSSFIATTTSIAAHFDRPVAAASADEFVVHGGLRGRDFIGQAYGGGGTLTSPAGAFLPNEVVEVTLTRELGICWPYVARFRVASAAGGGSFGTPVGYGASNPEDVAVGDVDRDGDVDLVVANRNPSRVQIFPGDGTGAFGTPQNIGMNHWTEVVALGDLNGDGWLDLIGTVTGDPLVVALSDGVGGFGAAVDYPVGADPFSLAIGDLDGDGDPDVVAVTAGGGAGNIAVLLNEGDGTLGAATGYPQTEPLAAALGDLDRDGDLDLVTGDAEAIVVMLNDGFGSFGVLDRHPVGGQPRSIAVADLDRDGTLDVLTTLNLPTFNDSRPDVLVLAGTGDGGLGSPASYSTGVVPGGLNRVAFDLAVGDLDGDGFLDVAAATQDLSSDFTQIVAGVSVLLNDGTGGLAVSMQHDFAADPGRPGGVAVADLDGDGTLELVVTETRDEDVFVFPSAP